MTRTTLGCLVLLVATSAFARAADPGTDFFEAKVRPILVAKCYSCHSADAKKVRGGLLLDTKAGWLKGGEMGPAIVPGDPLTYDEAVRRALEDTGER